MNDKQAPVKLTSLEAEMRSLLIQISREIFPDRGDMEAVQGKLSTDSLVRMNIVLQETRPDRPEGWVWTKWPLKGVD